MKNKLLIIVWMVYWKDFIVIIILKIQGAFNPTSVWSAVWWISIFCVSMFETKLVLPCHPKSDLKWIACEKGDI